MNLNRRKSTLQIFITHIPILTFFQNLRTRETTNKKTVDFTQASEDKKKFHGILIEAEVDWLWVENGTDEITFSSEKPWEPIQK